MKAVLILPIAWMLAALGGCTHARTDPPPPPSPPASPIGFTDQARAAGIDFSLGHGGRSPLTILETAGGGAAFFDVDGDGTPDALLVGPHRVGLFLNLGGGHFRDTAATSGLDPSAYWMGCAAADYDGDGRVDVLLTGYGRTSLYRNVTAPGGPPRFEDATRAAGLNIDGWTMSGAFADYDLDGRVDLYVTRYVRFDSTTLQLCQLGQIRSACGPEMYDPQIGVLFHNLGGGRFRDVTREVGALSTNGKTWAALFSDLNGDGYPDLYLANDMTPCDYFVNERGRFRAAGAQAGIAYDASGFPQGAMGVDSGDYDGDGRPDLLVTTFFAQPTSLYHNDGGGFFKEVGTATGLGAPTQAYVKFGTGFLDADNDGWPDVFIASGHVRDDIRLHDAGQDYAQPLQVLRNTGGRFTEVSRQAGPPFLTPLVGRGAAFGDYDRDGRLDVLVANLEGRAVLLHNDSDPANHWLRVRLRSSGGNTQALGARVTLDAGGRRQQREVRTCGSVMSAHDPVAHFGLGKEPRAARLEVHWPDGHTTLRENVDADQTLDISDHR